MKKILCLHGYAQNSISFKNLLNPLIKKLNQNYEFIFLEGLFPVVGGGFDPNQSKDTNLFSWSWADPDKDQALNQALIYIIKYIDDNGPFDFILGFSQGAVTLSILIQLIYQLNQFQSYFVNELKLNDIDIIVNKLKQSLRGIILISGYFKPFNHLKELSQVKCDLPALHVIGEWDTVVHPDKSEELIKYYINSKVIKHPGGHFLPTQANYLNQIENFLNLNC